MLSLSKFILNLKGEEEEETGMMKTPASAMDASTPPTSVRDGRQQETRKQIAIKGSLLVAKMIWWLKERESAMSRLLLESVFLEKDILSSPLDGRTQFLPTTRRKK